MRDVIHVFTEEELMNRLARRLIASVLTFPVAAATAPGDTEVISFNVRSGLAVTAWDHDLSDDGRYVVFAASDPVTDFSIPEYTSFVYIRDRTLRRTEMVSRGAGGQRANGWCDDADISGDGRFILMDCMATNMIAGDDRPAGLVLYDRVTRTNQRVALATWGHAISGNGRYVAFSTPAALVPNDRNDALDVYLWDRRTLVTERVSVGYGAGQPSGTGDRVDVSDDGRFVTFVSSSPNLVPGDTNGVADVFVRDRLSKVTRRVSVSSTGVQGDAASGWWNAISGNGQIVTFNSRASTLVPNDSNTVTDLFTHDLQTGVTKLVNVNSTGAASRDNSVVTVSPDGDGRRVVFASGARHLVPNDTNRVSDVFVRDRTTRTTTRASVDSSGAESAYPANSYDPAISGDGRVVAFLSSAANWGTEKLDNWGTILYVHELAPASALPVTLSPVTARFGGVAVGAKSGTRQITVKNVSSATVTITGVYLGGPSPGEYRRTSRCPEQLKPGASCVVDVVYAPTSAGTRTARLFVNIGGDPIVKAASWLNGTGL